mmetsp:Transcript_83338/g.231257  ORF Transcript_83338/g.231257 Transcript_83338/m.231257 type:complete len:132 (-) Transcript_83338:55-450(-)
MTTGASRGVGSSNSKATGPLIEDMTPADRRAAQEVARYELQSLAEGRKVYLQRGALFFLSSKREAWKSLSLDAGGSGGGGDGAQQAGPPAVWATSAAAKPARTDGSAASGAVGPIDATTRCSQESGLDSLE